MVDLLPCPGCGGTRIGGPYFDEREGMHYLSCISKVASCWWSVYGGTPDEASTRWNRRAPPPAPAITRGELVEIMRANVRVEATGMPHIASVFMTGFNTAAAAILSRLGETK